MAGDWIKMERGTPEKPEVLAITVRMGWDDPDLTVGKLFRLWCWFDQHTTDGNAIGVTPALLDRYLCVSGFIDAVALSGWVVVNSDGISLPNFDKHNGASAKKRGLTAKRVANHKTNASTNARSVSEALPREEKRREEKNKESKQQRGSRLASDWFLPKSWGEWALAERPDLDPRKVAAEFRDYWVSVPGQKGSKLDWEATWRNWVRNQKAAKIAPADIARVTVPAQQGPDPALQKIIADSLSTKPPPADIRARLAELSKGKI